MAIPIRSVPVLEGEVARRFLKEAKENEKKRGTHRFSEESIASYRRIIEKAKEFGTLPLYADSSNQCN
ncbi:MAG: hypothetical protein LBC47_06055 [Tannerella sp.]|jgi:hypothetical protein|nr:hypothetical protein [Tannerella sp.]